jgi:Fe(3+) dicitrate transport protein
MKKNLSAVLLLGCITATAQHVDSTRTVELSEVKISDKLPKNEIERLPEVQGTVIYAGKKNEVIKVSSLDADLSTNNTRQIFSKVPGVTIWENDGSGIQVGVSARGLSPNRSWEFNVRQNGYDICAEVFGYPEAYYSPPMEALEKIELVRGASSLQFGPQFGGLLNYVIKKPAANKPVVFETQQTIGTYGLYNSYNALGGTYGKISYYGYFHHRNADGWRENSRYNINTGYASINFAATSKLNIGLEYTRMDYLSQQPGGLTDSLFNIDAQQSLRSRNWFSAPWNVAAFTIDYSFSENSKLTIKGFTTISERSSVGFTKAINVADTINTSIKSYTARQVDRDSYNNFGSEIRYLKTYKLLRQQSTLAAGVRIYKGETIRRQLGVGTTGSDFDLDISAASNGKDWGRDLEFSTMNTAVFAENIFRLSERFSITPGIRYEMINTEADGYITTASTGVLNGSSHERKIVLFGAGTEFKTTKSTNIYANFSQAYRPVTYSELTPSATTEIIDPDMKDASGYNADFGFRGKVKNALDFDIGGFFLNYKNRIGIIAQGSSILRTNIGTSESKGVEAFVGIDPIRFLNPDSRVGFLYLYTSYAYINANYTSWNNPAIANDPAKAIEGKRVENSPETIARFGAEYRLQKFSVNYQLNNVSSVYTDAANTEKPNAAATTGKIDGYSVMDLSLTYHFAQMYNVKAGINNVADEKYATRRAGGYPGPGLMPANGRTMYVSIGAKF